MSALITGADQRQGLAVIRSLGKQGIPMVIGGVDSKSLGFYSRYARDVFVYTSPNIDKEKCVRRILDKAKEFNVKLIIPVVESTLIILDEYREQVEKIAPLAAASSHSLRLALDKKLTLELAQSLGIPIPKTKFISDYSEIEDIANDLRFPLVMKRRAPSLMTSVPPQPRFKVAYAHSFSEFQTIFKDLHETGGFPMVQEFQEGTIINICALMDKGDPLALFQYKTLQAIPLIGGAGVYRESMLLTPALKDAAVELLRAMNWKGVAHVGFKYDFNTHQFSLMEVNARFWSSLGGVINSGVDFALLNYELFVLNRRTKIDSYPVGVRTKWFHGQLNSSLDYYLGRERFVSNNMLPLSKTLFLMIGSLAPWIKDDVFSFSDIVPGLIDKWSLLWGSISKIGNSLFIRIRQRNRICKVKYSET